MPHQWIVAKSEGELAEEHGIPIRQDPDLVAVLAKLDPDTEIPNELYQPIAEILSFLYRVNEQQKTKIRAPTITMEPPQFL